MCEKLGISHRLAAGYEPHGVIGRELLDQVLEVLEGNKVHQLRKDRATVIRERDSIGRKCNSHCSALYTISNRPTHSSLRIRRHVWVTAVHVRI